MCGTDFSQPHSKALKGPAPGMRAKFEAKASERFAATFEVSEFGHTNESLTARLVMPDGELSTFPTYFHRSELIGVTPVVRQWKVDDVAQAGTLPVVILAIDGDEVWVRRLSDGARYTFDLELLT